MQLYCRDASTCLKATDMFSKCSCRAITKWPVVAAGYLGNPRALHRHDSLCSDTWVWCHFRSLIETKCLICSVLMFTEPGPFFSISDGGLILFWMPLENRAAHCKAFSFPCQESFSSLKSWFISFVCNAHTVHEHAFFKHIESNLLPHVLVQIFYWITKLTSFVGDFLFVFTKGIV